MTPDDTTSRAQAVAQLTDEPADDGAARCGPEPQRPDYFSPQAVRDRWLEWKLCKSDA